MKILTAPIVIADLDLTNVVMWKKALNIAVTKVTGDDQKHLDSLLDFLHDLHDAHPDLNDVAKAAEALTGEDDQVEDAEAVDPDFDPMAMRQCYQTGPFATPVDSTTDFGKKYQVQYTAYGKWICNCASFQQRGTACAHINKVQSERCDWHQLLHGGSSKAPKHLCPKCGGPTREV